MAIACAAALTAACTADVRDENRPVNETEQFETADDRVGTTGIAGETGGAAGVNGDVREFVEKAAHGGMAEVQLGQLAAERAQSAEVKQFGQMMVRDHTRASDELKQAVAPYNITVPSQLDEDHRELMQKLQNLQGAEFDREYIAALVDGHLEMQYLLAGRADAALNDPQSHGQTNPAATEGTQESANAALNQWALKTIPSVDAHLKTAQEIQDKLEDGNRNSTN
jgi:putative membrane protein